MKLYFITLRFVVETWLIVWMLSKLYYLFGTFVLVGKSMYTWYNVVLCALCRQYARGR